MSKKRRISKKCYTFKKTVNDWGKVFSFWEKVALSASGYKKYKDFVLNTCDFEEIYPNIEIKKHKDCGCK